MPASLLTKIRCTLCLIPLACLTSRAAPEYGLSFHSYEVVPSERTSLSVPSAKGRLDFSSQAEISFDFRIIPEREKFGYLCRIIADDKQSMDILVTSPVSGTPYLIATDSRSELVPLKTTRIYQWQRADIQIRETEGQDSLVCSWCGDELFKIECSRWRKHSLRVLFGRNDQEGFATTDAAPLVIRDLTVRLDDKHIYEWHLTGNQELGKYGFRHRLSTHNPDWLMDDYRGWKKILEVRSDSKLFHTVDKERKLVYFINRNKVIRIKFPPRIRQDEFSFQQDLMPEKLTNDFVVSPDGDLLYIGLERGTVRTARFDFESSSWSGSVSLRRHSLYGNHTSFFNPYDSTYVQMFGYGFHQYLRELHRISPDGTDRDSLLAIPPRYLCALGITDTTAWLLGGKGNQKGIQELGAEIYNDLYTLDLRDYSLEYVRDIDNPDGEVSCSELVVNLADTTLTGLFFCPDEYNSHLSLKRYSIASGQAETLSNAIPFTFIDVESQVSLLYDDEADIYYACIIEKQAEGSYSGTIYSIKCPILPPEGAESKPWISYLLAGVLLLAAVSALLVYREREKRKNRQMRYRVPASSLKDNSVGIHLLGNLRVIDKDGNDISAGFTPLMRQLLCLLILYTENQNSISNAELKEILWDDKTDESFFNNRGVQFRNLRSILEKVSDQIQISSENGNWSIRLEDGICDYCSSLRMLLSTKNDALDPELIDLILTLTGKGTLLSEMRYSWLDRFKADYTDAAMSALYKALHCRWVTNDPEKQIQLADNILLFDSLDEDAVRAKCRALLKLKRSGTAKNVFTKFALDYRQTMGESFAQSFNDFCKEN